MFSEGGVKAKLLMEIVFVAITVEGAAFHEDVTGAVFPEEVMGAKSWSRGSSSSG